MAKKITSRPGFFGTVNHYDEKGKKIGESRPGLFGTTNHYDSRGQKVGSSNAGVFASQIITKTPTGGHNTTKKYNNNLDAIVSFIIFLLYNLAICKKFIFLCIYIAA